MARARASARAGPATIRVGTPRAQHYVQSLCQFSVYAYWGWYWPPVYDFVPLLLGQLLFAYAFDMLLAWSRRRRLRPRLRPLPDRLQHQPVSLVQGRLVRPAVRADRAWIPRQGVRALAARRPARAHLQSVGVHARGVLAASCSRPTRRTSPGGRRSPPPSASARASTPCCSSSASSSCTSSRSRR